MKINAFADVSLRAMMVLAAAPDGGLLTTQSIADAVATPYNHVSKAMAKLRELGMIDVERGRHGGSRLSSAGRMATVGQLLRQLDTRTDPADCVGAGGACPLINECRLRGALSRPARPSTANWTTSSSRPCRPPGRWRRCSRRSACAPASESQPVPAPVHPGHAPHPPRPGIPRFEVIFYAM